MRRASSFVAIACLTLTACSGSDDENTGGGDNWSSSGGSPSTGGTTFTGGTGPGAEPGPGPGSGGDNGSGGFPGTGGGDPSTGRFSDPGASEELRDGCDLPELRGPVAPANGALAGLNCAGQQHVLFYPLDVRT